MNTTDEQFQDNLSETTQVTFKLTRREKEFIEKQAELLGMNLSEFCRISCTASESDVVSLKSDFSRLQKENRVLRVNLNFYKGATIDTNSVVFQLTEEQRALLERLYRGYDSNSRNLAEDILSFLAYISTWEKIWVDLFSDKGYTKEYVRRVLYPEAWYGE